MSRVIHGIVSKMDNGKKAYSKKVVRRAVRRAAKSSIKSQNGDQK